MQIPSIPPPLITNPLPQDMTAKVVPHIQATAPLLQRAVSQAPKSDKSNQNRSNKDKNKGSSFGADGKESDANKDERGHSVNIDV